MAIVCYCKRVAFTLENNIAGKAVAEYINGNISEIDELRDELIDVEDSHARSMLLWKDWKYMTSVYIV